MTIEDDVKVQTQPKRDKLFLLLNIGVTSALTVVAGILCSLSLARIQQIYPEYPWMMNVQSYMPLAPITFLHSMGVIGLIVLLLLGVGLALSFWRSNRFFVSKLRVVSFGLHFCFLLVAIFGYSFSLWRLSGYLLLFVQGSR